jgi:hypothetical protein
VGLLRVDANGLGVLASKCESLAGELNGIVAPGGVGPTCQATSAAVNAVHADIGSTSAALVARMQATVAKLSAAGTAYGSQDGSSAIDLETAGESVEV